MVYILVLISINSTKKFIRFKNGIIYENASFQ